MSKKNTNCSVSGCHSRKSKDTSVHFHYFPPKGNIYFSVTNKYGVVEQMEKRQAWEYVLSMRKPVSDHMRVCSKHFKTEDYRASSEDLVNKISPRLKRWAVPSQNLPARNPQETKILEPSSQFCNIKEALLDKNRNITGVKTLYRNDIRLVFQVEKEGMNQTYENRAWNSQDSVNTHHNRNTSVLIKKEYDNENEDSITFNNDIVGNEMSIDIKEELVNRISTIKTEYESEDEDSTTFKNNMVENEISIDIKEEFDNRIASIKKEYDNEDEDCPSLKNNIVGSDINMDINEELENRHMFETVFIKNYEDPNDNGIAEGPLVEVKKEDMSYNEGLSVDSLSQVDVIPKAGLNKALENSVVESRKPIPSKINLSQKNKHTEDLANGYKKCKICNNIYNNQSNLDIHMRLHTAERPYACEICKKTYITKQVLALHMRMHAEEWTHECEICQKKFKLKYLRDKHMRIHTGERPYECSTCGKKFIQKNHLDVHMHIHTGARPYECEVCKKTYIAKHMLANHMRMHTGEKPHECEICQKKFSQKYLLDKHIRIHTGERPYECITCEKKFTQKNHLDEHMRIHTGERPYECEVCKKTFITKPVLTNHMRIHSGERPHECEICSKKFIQKYHLDKHMRIHTAI